MKKKFICTVCGYIYEGEEAPAQCPICKAPASKFKEMTVEDEPEFATVHELGRAYTDKVSDELILHCKKHIQWRMLRSRYVSGNGPSS
jgi:rubredoxin